MSFLTQQGGGSIPHNGLTKLKYMIHHVDDFVSNEIKAASKGYVVEIGFTGFALIRCGVHGFLDFNTLRPRQNGCHFADDTFKRIFFRETVRILTKISLFFPKSTIDNIPALFQIMAWRRPGDKPLSEAMMVSSLTHICVTRPQ